MIHFNCKWCGKRYRAPNNFAGRADFCNACAKPIWVPRKPSRGPSLRFACVGCGKKYRTALRYAGITQPCRSCGVLVTAPGEAVPADAPVDPFAVSASPFEAETPDMAAKMVELESFLNLPPFELIPAADELPEAEFVPSVDGRPVDEDSPRGSPVPTAPVSLPTAAAAPPSQPLAAVIRAPVAVLVPAPVAIMVPPAAVPPIPPPPAASPPVPAAPSAVAPPIVPAIVTPPISPPPVLATPAAAAPPILPPPVPATAAAEPPAAGVQVPLPPPQQKGCPACGGEATYSVESRSPLGALCMLGGMIGGVSALAGMDKDWRIGMIALPLFGVAVWGAFMKRWTVICAQCERRLY